jgi:hypothetical protein
MPNTPNRAGAEAVLDLIFDGNGDVIEVVHHRRPAKVVLCARVPAELNEQVLAEADRCGQKPTHLVGQLVAEALAARTEHAEVVTVNAADLHRAIDTVLQQRAA